MAFTVPDRSGVSPPLIVGDPNTYKGSRAPSYSLANNITLAATTGTSAVTVKSGSYIFDTQFTGTSIQLQARGSDGTTWRTVATASTSGPTGVVLGDNASVRLYNPNSDADTNVYASLT